MSKPNHKPDECPACFYRVNSVTVIDDDASKKPKPGDFSVCLNCGELLRFDNRLELVAADEDAVEDLDPSQLSMIRKAQGSIRRRGPLVGGELSGFNRRATA